VFAAGKYKPTDSDDVHTADGFTDDGESVLANLAIRHQVVRPDQIARINIGFRNNSSISMVRFESRAMFSSSSFDTSCRYRSRPCSPNFLAGIGIHLHVLAIFSESEVTGYKATGQVQIRFSRFPPNAFPSINQIGRWSAQCR
jgi:hypothetical protein